MKIRALRPLVAALDNSPLIDQDNGPACACRGVADVVAMTGQRVEGFLADALVGDAVRQRQLAFAHHQALYLFAALV